MLASTCLCTRTRRAALALSDVYDAALAPAGLKVTQFALLRTIRRLDAPTLTVLSDATGLDRSTLGRNVRVLDRMGLVRLKAGRDERTRIVALTDAGGDALALAEPLWQAVQARVAAEVPPADRRTFEATLDRLAALAPDTAVPEVSP